MVLTINHQSGLGVQAVAIGRGYRPIRLEDENLALLDR